MTKIAVTGPASGTGTFTLTTPVSSSDRTLTFPDSTGTVLNDQSNIEAQVKTATNASGSAPIYSCRAWCNFNGTGTVAIRASGNVSSITDNGTGDYTVNFTTAMPDVNYSAVIGASPDFGVAVTVSMNIASGSGTEFAPTTTALRFSTGSTLVYHDVEYASVAIFR
jgi:hypothetical protein